MKDLLTLRIEETDKEALALSSKLAEMPVSKIITPFIIEGTKVSLGTMLLFHTDRSRTFDRRSFDDLTSLMMEPLRTGTRNNLARNPDEIRGRYPSVIWDFFEILAGSGAIERLNEELDEVTITMDTSFVTPDLMRFLCYRMGDEYMVRGGSLNRLDFQLASEIFFDMMMMECYRHGAKGTSKALSTELYRHRETIKNISIEIMRLYNERTAKRKFEAIEVEPVLKRRGRPPKNNKVQKVVAREITE